MICIYFTYLLHHQTPEIHSTITGGKLYEKSYVLRDRPSIPNQIHTKDSESILRLTYANPKHNELGIKTDTSAWILLFHTLILI